MSARTVDPFDNFKFRVIWDGRPIPGITRISSLTRTTDVFEHREGGDPNSSRKLAGLTHFPAITLERGLSSDDAFEKWASEVCPFPTGPSASNFRKDVNIELLDETGRAVIVFHLFSCWVSEYQVFEGLDANADAVAMEMIRLENEGWTPVRD